MALIDFLASPVGRIVRIVAGVVIIFLGLFAVGNTAGFILALIGFVPLLAGMVDVCVFAPLFKLPFNGKDIRNR